MYGQGLSRWPQGGGGAAAGLVTRARAQAVAVRLTTAERSFYEQIVARARPARAALQAEDAAGGAAGAAGGAPGAPTAAEARRRRAARERALGAAGEALLQARRCCDHPQLTAYWRTLAADLQLGQARARCSRPPRPEPLPQAPPVSGGPCPPIAPATGVARDARRPGRAAARVCRFRARAQGVLAMGEVQERLAEMKAAELQAAERELCGLLNAAAAVALRAAGAPPASAPPAAPLPAAAVRLRVFASAPRAQGVHARPF